MRSSIVVCVVIMVLAATMVVWAAFEVDLRIAPNLLVMGGPGQWVTAHAGIPLSEVDASSVQLNGLPAAVVKADLQGNLVGKFRQEDIEPTVEPPCANMELTGLTSDGEQFFGTAVVRVK